MTPAIALVHAGHWLHEWQTLVSGLLALGAAWWATAYVRRQIAQTDQLHRQDVERRHNAARVMLPLALAGIGAFLQTMADAVADEIERSDPPIDTPDGVVSDAAPTGQGHFDVPDLPVDQLNAIRDFAETLTDQCNLRHLAELIGQLQIAYSRYATFNFSHVNCIDLLYDLLLKIAVLKTLNERMFNYARFVDDTDFGIVEILPIGECWDMILGSLVGLVFNRSRMDLFASQASERIKAYKTGGMSPWLQVFQA